MKERIHLRRQMALCLIWNTLRIYVSATGPAAIFLNLFLTKHLGLAWTIACVVNPALKDSESVTMVTDS